MTDAVYAVTLPCLREGLAQGLMAAGLLLLCTVGVAKGAEDGSYTIGQTAAPQVVVRDTPSEFSVYPGRPRLFFRDTDLPTIRARIAGSHQEEWQWLVGLADRMVERDPETCARKPKAWQPGRNTTFVAVVTGEESYREWALRWADLMIEAGPDEGPDDNYRGRLMSLAIVYDWLYPWLDEGQKTRLRDSIIAHIERNWYFAERPNFIGGHSRWGNFALAAGLLAVITERPDLQPRLRRVRENWLQGYHPAQGWIAVDGGYHMGWAYGASYTKVRNHAVWSSATDECVYYPWRGQLPYFWIYGDRGDGIFHGGGDNFSNTSTGDWGSLVVAAGVLKNPHAAWYVQNLSERSSYRDRFWDVLYGDKSVKPLAPDDAANPLPLSRHFQHAGVVLMRDRWDDRSTLLHFKCSDFISINHHHRDENAFTLSYRGRLAIDSGSYQKGSSYGAPHWHNYFTRTIAHNSITVFDPEESFGEISSGPRSNDGGQKWISDVKTLDDILPDGYAALEGITSYADEGSYAFAVGDATRAYSDHKLARFSRSMVYLREPTGWERPIIVVFDDVAATKAEYRKRFLLHSVDEPDVEAPLIEIREGDGKLFCTTLLPQDAQFEKIGGPGRRYWVNDRNWDLDFEGMDAEAISDIHKWTGEWRVEISPPTPSTEDHFLHVLAVSDRDRPTAPPKADLVQSEALVGALVDGDAVLFNRATEALSSAAYRLHVPGAGTHLLLGVAPSRPWALRASDRTLAQATSTSGGSVRFIIPPDARRELSFTAETTPGRG